MFWRTRVELPFIVKSPKVSSVGAELVPAATVLLIVAAFVDDPVIVRDPCVPLTGASAPADRVPPSPIETIPPFLTEFVIGTPTMAKVLALVIVTSPVPNAAAFFAYRAPPSLMIVPPE